MNIRIIHRPIFTLITKIIEKSYTLNSPYFYNYIYSNPFLANRASDNSKMEINVASELCLGEQHMKFVEEIRKFFSTKFIMEDVTGFILPMRTSISPFADKNGYYLIFDSSYRRLTFAYDSMQTTEHTKVPTYYNKDVPEATHSLISTKISAMGRAEKVVTSHREQLEAIANLVRDVIIRDTNDMKSCNDQLSSKSASIICKEIDMSSSYNLEAGYYTTGTIVFEFEDGAKALIHHLYVPKHIAVYEFYPPDTNKPTLTTWHPATFPPNCSKYVPNCEQFLLELREKYP